MRHCWFKGTLELATKDLSWKSLLRVAAPEALVTLACYQQYTLPNGILLTCMEPSTKKEELNGRCRSFRFLIKTWCNYLHRYHNKYLIYGATEELPQDEERWKDWCHEIFNDNFGEAPIERSCLSVIDENDQAKGEKIDDISMSIRWKEHNYVMAIRHSFYDSAEVVDALRVLHWMKRQIESRVKMSYPVSCPKSENEFLYQWSEWLDDNFHKTPSEWREEVYKEAVRESTQDVAKDVLPLLLWMKSYMKSILNNPKLRQTLGYKHEWNENNWEYWDKQCGLMIARIREILLPRHRQPIDTLDYTDIFMLKAMIDETVGLEEWMKRFPEEPSEEYLAIKKKAKFDLAKWLLDWFDQRYFNCHQTHAVKQERQSVRR